MSSPKNQRKAYLFALLAVVLWSTVATAFKLTLRHLNFIDMLFYASWTSTFYLMLTVRLSDSWKLLKKPRTDWVLRSIVMGLINPFLYYLVLFKAYSLLPAQIAQPLNYTWPIALVVLSAIFLSEPITLRAMFALTVSFLGVIVISDAFHPEGHRFSTVGVLLAIGSAFLWATYWILNLRDKRPSDLKLFMNFLAGSLFVTGVAFAFSSPLKVPLSGVLGSVYIGIFEMGATFFVWLKALELAENQAPIANLIYLSPFISLIFIHFVLGETILTTTVIGLLLILAGILLQKK